jgi:hypothetical protein
MHVLIIKTVNLGVLCGILSRCRVKWKPEHYQNPECLLGLVTINGTENPSVTPSKVWQTNPLGSYKSDIELIRMIDDWNDGYKSKSVCSDYGARLPENTLSVRGRVC